MDMTPSHLLDVRDKAALLEALARALAGNAFISFEGDLSSSGLADIPGASQDETPVLRRNTISPRQEFLVLPLEPNTTSEILDAVVPRGGIARRVLHIQIAKAGRLAFGAYDQFHPECTVAFQDVPVSLLADLARRGVLKSYAPQAPTPR